MEEEKFVVKKYANLVYKMAQRFYGADKDDLYQAGMIGLIKAIRSYKENFDAKFTTFAYKYIFGEMYKIAGKSLIKVSPDVIALYNKIERKRYELALNFGRLPNNNEIANAMNLDVNIIEKTCASVNPISSLDEESDDSRSFYETIASTPSVSEDDRIMLKDTLKVLPEMERKVLIGRYFYDETQSSIASKLKTSQVKVSRLEKRGLVRMRTLLS